MERIDAIALAGGSAFGLEAGGGVQAWLAEQGRGYVIRGAVIPIVAGAICFDLLNGGDKKWGRFSPYRDLGYAAATAAGETFALGSVGAGLGATTANFKGGLGSASAMTQAASGSAHRGRQRGRSVTVGNGPWFWAAPFENRRRVWRARIAAVVHPRHAGDADQGRSCRELGGKHHARRRGHGRGADKAPGQAATRRKFLRKLPMTYSSRMSGKRMRNARRRRCMFAPEPTVWALEARLSVMACAIWVTA